MERRVYCGEIRPFFSSKQPGPEECGSDVGGVSVVTFYFKGQSQKSIVDQYGILRFGTIPNTGNEYRLLTAITSL